LEKEKIESERLEKSVVLTCVGGKEKKVLLQVNLGVRTWRTKRRKGKGSPGEGRTN
jgi:hypothetical protein